MEAIVAVYEDWGIGNGQTQPVVLHADRTRFREITASAAIVLGRKTLEDFPNGRPLEGRKNIILTHRDVAIPEAEIVHSTEEVLTAAEKYSRCVIIGGASVYHQMFPYIDKVYITKIECRPESSVFFPNLDREKGWVCTEEGPCFEENGIYYRFCIYERKGEKSC